MSKFFKNAIAKNDKTIKLPRINNKQLATNPVKNTQGKIPTQFKTLQAEALFNNFSTKTAGEKEDRVKEMTNIILGQQTGPIGVKDVKEEVKVVKEPKIKRDRRGEVVDTIPPALSKEIDDHSRKSNSTNTYTQVPINMLWNEYKGSLSRDEFKKMIKEKQLNIKNQKIVDADKPDILEFGPGGKRMVKSDSYPNISDERLNEDINVEVMPRSAYNYKHGPNSVGQWNPGNKTMSIQTGDVTDTGSHELRHVLHDISNETYKNRNLYSDYPEPVRRRHVNDAYVNDPDVHQTDHHLVDLGMLHSLYVNHGNDPVINKDDTDNFMKWYKTFKTERKGEGYSKGHLFKLDPDSKLDEEFLRRNMPLVVEAKGKKPKNTSENKLASLGFTKESNAAWKAITWPVKKARKYARKNWDWAKKHPWLTGGAVGSVILDPGYEAKKALDIKAEPNLFDDWFLFGFPLTQMIYEDGKVPSGKGKGSGATTTTDSEGKLLHPTGQGEVKKNKDGSYSNDAQPGQYEDHGTNRYWH